MLLTDLTDELDAPVAEQVKPDDIIPGPIVGDLPVPGLIPANLAAALPQPDISAPVAAEDVPPPAPTPAELESGSFPASDFPEIQATNPQTTIPYSKTMYGYMSPYLRNLQRPGAALWGGVANSFANTEGFGPGEEHPFWPGFRQGWNLKSHENMLTAFGFQRPGEINDRILSFPEYAARAGSLFLADMLGDPLFAILGGAKIASKATGLTPVLEDASFLARDWLAGTGFGKAFFNSLPEGSEAYKAAQAAADAINLRQSPAAISAMARRLRPEYEKALEPIIEAEGSADPLKVFTAMELWGKDIPTRTNYLEPALKTYAETGQIQPFLRSELELGNVPQAIGQDMRAGNINEAVGSWAETGKASEPYLADWLGRYKNPEWIDEWGRAGEVPAYYADAVGVLKGLKDTLQETRKYIRGAQVARDIPLEQRITDITEDAVRHVPQIAVEARPPWMGFKNWFWGRNARLDPSGVYNPSREIMMYVDRNNNIRAVGKASDQRTGMTELTDAANPDFQTPIPRYSGNSPEALQKYISDVASGEPALPKKYLLPDGTELVERQAPLIYKQQLTPYLNWQTDPFNAYVQAIARQMPVKNYYQLMDQLEGLNLVEGTTSRLLNEGIIPQREPIARSIQDIYQAMKSGELPARQPNYANVNPDLAGMYTSGDLFNQYPGNADIIPKTWWRQIDKSMPGGEGLQAPKTVANWLENMYAPNPYQKLMDTGPWQLMNDSTQWWKNATLPLYMAWLAMNTPAHIAMNYLRGMPAYNMLGNFWRAGKTALKSGSEVAPGLTGAEMADELASRSFGSGTFKEAWQGKQGFIDPNTAPGEFYSMGNKFYGNKTRDLANYVSEITPDNWLGSAITAPFNAAARFAEGYGALNRMGYQLGSKVAENNRMGAIFDILDSMNPNWSELPVLERGELIDSAMREMGNRLVDFGKTPFEKFINPFFPYYSWTKGNVKSMAQSLMENPMKLQRYNQALENFMEPVPDKDKKIMNRWMQDQLPVKSWMGIPIKNLLGSPEGPGGIGLIARATPLKDIIELLDDPARFAWTRFVPSIKSVFNIMGNYDSEMARNIDVQIPALEKQGIPQNLFAPLTNPLWGPPTSYSLASRNLLGKKISSGWDYMLGQSVLGRLTNEYIRPLSNLAYGQATGKNLDPNRPEQSKLFPTLLQIGTGQRMIPFNELKNYRSQDFAWNQEMQRLRNEYQEAIEQGDSQKASLTRNKIINMPKQNPWLRKLSDTWPGAWLR